MAEGTGGRPPEEMGGPPERDSLRIIVNGKEREVARGTTVAGLLDELGLAPGMVVVEHNRAILERARLGEVPLAEGDRLELVHFVGGG